MFNPSQKPLPELIQFNKQDGSQIVIKLNMYP